MSGRVTAVDVVDNNKDVWYVGTGSGGLWKTTNGGTTFEPIFDDQPATSIGDVTVHPENPDVIWVGTGEGNPRNSATGGNGVYRSRDGGETWTRFDKVQVHGTIMSVGLHASDPEQVYIGARYDGEVFGTRDGGETWQALPLPGPVKDIYAVACG